MLVAGVFLVAAIPAVANACSEENGPCTGPDDNDMCMVDAPMCYAEDEPADEEPTTTQPTTTQPADEEPSDDEFEDAIELLDMEVPSVWQ